MSAANDCVSPKATYCATTRSPCAPQAHVSSIHSACAVSAHGSRLMASGSSWTLSPTTLTGRHRVSAICIAAAGASKCSSSKSNRPSKSVTSSDTPNTRFVGNSGRPYFFTSCCASLHSKADGHTASPECSH